MGKTFLIVTLLSFGSLSLACGNSAGKERSDSLTVNSINFSVSEKGRSTLITN